MYLHFHLEDEYSDMLTGSATDYLVPIEGYLSQLIINESGDSGDAVLEI